MLINLKSSVFRLALAAVFFSAPLAAADDPFEIVPVADGVFAAIGRPTAPMAIGSNAAIIVNADDVLVVDTHLTPAAARALLGQMARLTDKPVRYVVNTHWHNDHTQGNRAYVNVFPGGAEYIAQHATREDIVHKAIPFISDQLSSVPLAIARLEEQLAKGVDEQGRALSEAQKQERGLQLSRQNAYLEELQQMQITLPTLTFERSLVLHKPGRTLHILFFFKGHTRGDAVVFLPQERVLITGDLVTHGMPFPRDSYPSQWAHTLRALAQLDFDQLIPGHGPVQKGKEHVELLASLFEFLSEQVRAGVAQGKSLEEIMKAVDLARFQERLPGSSPRLLQALERAYNEAGGHLKD